MKSTFYSLVISLILVSVFALVHAEIDWHLPIEDSKVNYHKTTICITADGVTNCAKANKIPGDPKEVADMFKIIKKQSETVAEKRKFLRSKSDDKMSLGEKKLKTKNLRIETDFPEQKLGVNVKSKDKSKSGKVFKSELTQNVKDLQSFIDMLDNTKKWAEKQETQIEQNGKPERKPQIEVF